MSALGAKRVMRKQYRSPATASIHETAEGLHAAGVMAGQTMREFDEACLIAAASEPAFAAVWDNPEDDAYDAI